MHQRNIATIFNFGEAQYPNKNNIIISVIGKITGCFIGQIKMIPDSNQFSERSGGFLIYSKENERLI